MPIDVRHLSDVPGALPLLARWFVEEWEPYYGESGPGDAEADLAEPAGPSGLPVCLVAVDGGQVIGTVALRAQQLPSHTHLGPWMAGLLVTPSGRGRGVAAALIDAIVEEARRLGFPRLYVGTDRLSGAMARRGWRAVDEAPTLRGPTTIFRLDLQVTSTIGDDP